MQTNSFTAKLVKLLERKMLNIARLFTKTLAFIIQYDSELIIQYDIVLECTTLANKADG